MKIKKAVIPAAGLGTRMLPATKAVPKEMLPLLDKPAIHYVIEEAAASGIEDILIITNRNKNEIEDYFDYSPELEEVLTRSGKSSELAAAKRPAEIANILYVRQKETKGLGHAVWRAKSFIGDEPFAVLLADDIMVADTPVIKQLIDAAEKYGASAVGTQRVKREEICRYSSLKISPLEDRVYSVSDVNEKPPLGEEFSDFAILGRYVLSPDIFDIIEKTPPGYGGEIQLTDGLRGLCAVSPMIAVDFAGRRYDIGTAPGFVEATIDFALKDPDIGAWTREFIKLRINS